MSEMTFNVFILLGILSVFAASEALYMPGYYFPSSYQRYMDEHQAVLRQLMSSTKDEQAPLPEVEIKKQIPRSVADAKDVAAAPPSQLMPRRDQRQFFYAPQFKRMRPCFYSPIQCLMKRSETDNQA